MKKARDLCRILVPGALICVAFSLGQRSIADQLPPDVRPTYWAAGAVGQILKSGVMRVQDDRQFHGEAHVTHLQAVIALAGIAKKLETGTWQAGESKAVPDSVGKTLSTTDWKSKPVTRYELASALVRFGNYYARAVPRPRPGARDLGKSDILPAHVKVPVAPASPAYEAYRYLTDGQMISSSSPLLKADASFVRAGELSRGIAEAADGITNKLTEMGHDEQGNTPDKSFQKKKP